MITYSIVSQKSRASVVGDVCNPRFLRSKSVACNKRRKRKSRGNERFPARAPESNNSQRDYNLALTEFEVSRNDELRNGCCYYYHVSPYGRPGQRCCWTGSERGQVLMGSFGGNFMEGFGIGYRYRAGSDWLWAIKVFRCFPRGLYDLYESWTDRRGDSGLFN